MAARGWDVQKWWECVELLSSAPQLTLLNLSFSQSHCQSDQPWTGLFCRHKGEALLLERWGETCVSFPVPVDNHTILSWFDDDDDNCRLVEHPVSIHVCTCHARSAVVVSKRQCKKGEYKGNTWEKKKDQGQQSISTCSALSCEQVSSTSAVC